MDRRQYVLLGKDPFLTEPANTHATLTKREFVAKSRRPKPMKKGSVEKMKKETETVKTMKNQTVPQL